MSEINNEERMSFGDAVDVIKKSTSPTRGDELSRKIIAIRDAINKLKMHLADIELHAIEFIREGNEVSGFKVVPQFSRIKWTLKDNDVLKLGESFNINVAKPPKLELITPLQAIKAGIPKEVVKQYSISEFKNYKLANQDDAPKEDEIDFDSL